ncbi:MAG: HNH endonuclease [Betaproteobacteria bacterium]|nr:HNH endonuclease [Betaproteobacteria bacterium]
MTKSKGILPPRKLWTDEEIAELRRLYPDTPTVELTARFERNVECIYGKARRLGLKKSAAFLASPAGGRLQKGHEKNVATRFKPGHVPWSKGTKGMVIGGKATQFKPGERGGRALEQYKPIGTERLFDGFLQRKITDEVPMHKRWRFVHRLLWEEANGAIPPDHAVIFKDGDKRNITLDNLELISRADLMRRNHYRKYGPEIVKVILLRGAVTRRIKKLEEENQS